MLAHLCVIVASVLSTGLGNLNQLNTEFSRLLVCLRSAVGIPSLTPPKRFSFNGGRNVTLRGSTDPEWGWIDGHGQAVRVIPSVFG